MVTSCRIGIIYRYSKKIQSVRVNYDGYLNGVGLALLNYFNDFQSDDNLRNIQKIIEKGDLRILLSDTKNNIPDIAHYSDFYGNTTNSPLKEDTSFVSYFYTTLNDSCNFYYLYEHGVGWSCGSTYSDTPISGFLLKLSDAIDVMEEFNNDKYLSTVGNTCKELIHFSENDIDNSDDDNRDK
jgi:hypothetical protein